MTSWARGEIAATVISSRLDSYSRSNGNIYNVRYRNVGVAGNLKKIVLCDIYVQTYLPVTCGYVQLRLH